MLVKFGYKGKEVREYYLEDDSNCQDLLDTLNIEMDYDDVLHVPGYEDVSVDDLEDTQLLEGGIYVLDAIYLTDQEKALINLIDGELDGAMLDDFNTKDQKEFIGKLVKMIHDQSWD